jgi:hypothetical protein
MNPEEIEQLRNVIREELNKSYWKRVKELEDCLRWILETGGTNIGKIRKVLEK